VSRFIFVFARKLVFKFMPFVFFLHALRLQVVRGMVCFTEHGIIHILALRLEAKILTCYMHTKSS